MWLSNYLQDDKTFREELEVLWDQMKPLYEKIHAYVRFRFRQYWGEDKIDQYSPIPAHLLGNMWAQTWENTLKIVTPFPNATNPLDEVNEALLNQVVPRVHCQLEKCVLQYTVDPSTVGKKDRI